MPSTSSRAQRRKNVFFIVVFPSGWLSVDPVRRQGYLTDAVLRSYWGTAYEQNYARLSAIVDEVLDEVLFYDNAPACTSYFAISNGRTEASEGTAR